MRFNRRQFLIRTPEMIVNAQKWVETMAKAGIAGGPVQVSIGREDRSIEQNAKLWVSLSDLMRQHSLIDGDGNPIKMDAADWKCFFVSALHNMNGQGSRIIRGYHGEFINLSLSSSKLNKRQFSDLIELIYSYGAQHGVKWSEPALKIYDEFREARVS